MTKLWQIAINEYKRNVFKKSFLLVLLSVPLMIAFNVGLGLFLERMGKNDLPVGYIDHTNLLSHAIPAPSASDKDRVEFIAFTSDTEAQSAVKEKEIQAYYVLPADYLDQRRIELVYINEPGGNARQQFFDFLQINMLADQPADVAIRTAEGTDITIRSVDGRRNIPSGGPSLDIIMPLLISIAFIALLLMSSGYLMSAVADEKENRTIEILVTTVSPMQLIGGKVLGIAGITLTIFVSWALVATTGIQIASALGVGWFQNLDMDWSIVISIGVIAIPAFIFTAALMTAIGSIATSNQEGQTISSVFVILHFIPLYIGIAFLKTPHSSLAVLLSLLPFTALTTVSMRSLFIIVPFWQIAVSIVVQSVFAVGALWVASRAFRFGILRFNQRLTWQSLFTRTNREA